MWRGNEFDVRVACWMDEWCELKECTDFSQIPRVPIAIGPVGELRAESWVAWRLPEKDAHSLRYRVERLIENCPGVCASSAVIDELCSGDINHQCAAVSIALLSIGDRRTECGEALVSDRSTGIGARPRNDGIPFVGVEQQRAGPSPPQQFAPQSIRRCCSSASRSGRTR
jgi:hypothetical protein